MYIFTIRFSHERVISSKGRNLYKTHVVYTRKCALTVYAYFGALQIYKPLVMSTVLRLTLDGPHSSASLRTLHTLWALIHTSFMRNKLQIPRNETTTKTSGCRSLLWILTRAYKTLCGFVFDRKW